MARIDELRLITRVARLYHEGGVKQPEIAERLGLSQPKVSRLLRQAIDIGVVRISVGVPTGAFPDVEERLEARYSLREAIVIDADSDNEAGVLRGLGSAAAYHLETTLRSGDVVGISSWSSTLLATVDAMHPVMSAVGTRVVQILGGVGSPSAEIHANHLTRRLAELIRGEALFLPAPGVVGSAAARTVLLDDPFVHAATDLFEKVTVALVGIGTLEPSGLLASSGNVFSSQELGTVRELGGVGDICLRFFDATGRPVPTPLDLRVIGMDLEQLRQLPKSVGVAAGTRKVAAIRGALEGRYINCLITDRATALELLADRVDEAPAPVVGTTRPAAVAST